MTSERPSRLVFFSLVMALVAVTVAIRAAGDIRDTARGMDFLHDDAYYHSEVARNMATTGRMTFDGISHTNGYHPLWFWLQVLMFKARVAGLSTIGQTVAIMLLQWSILGITILLFLRWAYREWLENPQVAVAVLAAVALLVYPKHMSVFALGMESTLVLPLVPLLLLLVWRSRWTMAGIAALLLAMSRLDSLVYVIFPITVYAAFSRWDSLARALRRGFSVGGPAVAAVAILMTVYRLTFGHAVPIHGVLRSTFPAVHFQPHLFSEPIALARALHNPAPVAMFGLPISLVVLPLCGLALLKAGHLHRPERRAAMLLAVLGLIQLAAFLLFQKWSKPISSWYLAALVIFSSGALGAALVNLIGSRRTLYLCFVFALGTASLCAFREYRRYHAPVPDNELFDFVESRPAPFGPPLTAAAWHSGRVPPSSTWTAS
jgi:hypothetical protein